MSLPTTHSPEPQATEDALDFLLPGSPPDLSAPIAPELLDSFVSSQSLTGHVALEGVSPFDGLYNVDGLFFIQLNGRTFEVEFDTDNVRYDIVSPRPHGQDNDKNPPAERVHKQVLKDWHPEYRANSRDWVLAPASASPDRSTDVVVPRLTTLPYRVDGLLRTADLYTIVSTVDGFLLERSTGQPQSDVAAQTLLSLLASPHLTALAPQGGIMPTRKTLSDTLDAMLRSDLADQLATWLLSALEWYGGEDGETTDPAIRQHLVWAALMLELDPPAQQRAGHVAGFDLEGLHNWGLTYAERRARIKAVLSLKTNTPELALYILGPAIPDFMVEDIDRDLRYGSAPWVNFAHGVALANALQPGSSGTLRFEELVQLPLNLTQCASDEHLQLIALTRAQPCVTWAIAHGVLQSTAGVSWSLSDINTATHALDEHWVRAIEAVKAITREAPDRIRMAMDKLRELFEPHADAVKERIMYPTTLAKKFEFSLKNPHINLPAGQFYLLDVFAAGSMINGLDQFEPIPTYSQTQAEANERFRYIRNKIRGINIPAMYEAAFDFYEAKAKLAYAFLIDNLLSRLPVADRRALQNGQVNVYVLSSWSGKLDDLTHAQQRARNRGRFGFVIECRYRGGTFFYEMFPILGLFVRHARFAPPNRLDPKHPSALPVMSKLTTSNEVKFDWNAYKSLAAPVAGRSAVVICERILDFAAPEVADHNAPITLASSRFKQIAFDVAENHPFFHPQDSRLHYRRQTPSEGVANTYPPILRTLELVVPGLACANALATNEAAVASCALEGAFLIGPAFKFLKGTARIMTKAGQLAMLGALPRFRELTATALLPVGARYMPAIIAPRLTASASDLISRTLRARAVNVQAIHTLGTRMHRHISTAASTAGSYSLVASVPSIRTPGTWRPFGAFDALGRVDGIKQVPVRSIPGSGSHYLITPDTGLPFGPRLIQKASFTPPQRINGQLGYALSGRGAMASPIASPNSGVMGEAIDASADIAAVLESHGITADAGQLEAIEMWLKEGAPVFLYETSTGRKSLVLHVVDEKIYQDLFTDAKVYFFRHYNHQTLGTWKVPPAMEGQIRQVKLDELLAGRSQLSSDRLSSVREAIIEGQHLPPIKVRPPSHGLYSVVDGNHRLEVARNLGLETVPVQIVDA